MIIILMLSTFSTETLANGTPLNLALRAKGSVQHRCLYRDWLFLRVVTVRFFPC
jgi:hypothetical protein